MRSMTGFGAGTAALGTGRLIAEVRSLNHKNQDIRMRIPSELAEHTSFVEQMVRGRLERGRYDLAVRIEGAIGAAPHLAIDKLKALYASMVELRDEVAPDSELSLTSLLHLPELVVSPGPDVEEARSSLKQAFENAKVQLDEMRQAEGASLLGDLAMRLDAIRDLRSQIQAAAADLVEHHRKRLQERLSELLGHNLQGQTAPQLAPGRLEQEIALVADRSDITEELVRLDSHFTQLGVLLSAEDPVGRRLDFLLQEVGREINTIGSKSQHAPVAHLVVEMKSEVERLREQVQNVE